MAIINGTTGNENLNGTTSNDTLDGGVGADTMIGGLGNDTYVVDNAGDVITELAGEGTDTVKSSITYTLGKNIEYLLQTGNSSINDIGNTLANRLTGNNGKNLLDGGAGSDTMIGGLGMCGYCC